MAGRKPKPTAVKKLEGNPEKRKLNGLYNLPVSEPGVLRTIGYLLLLFTAVGLYPLYRRIMKEIK